MACLVVSGVIRHLSRVVYELLQIGSLAEVVESLLVVKSEEKVERVGLGEDGLETEIRLLHQISEFVLVR